MNPTEALLRTALFGDLPASEVAELSPHLLEVRFGRGESVWSEGDPVTGLHVVVEGQLKAYRVSRDGAEVILEVVSSGEITGEAGLFHPSGVRQVCVAAMAPTRCLIVPKAALVAFMTRHPPVMLRMLESLSEVAVRVAYSFSDVAFADIRRRVARTLLKLAEEQGEPTPAGVRIRLKLSQGTLAAMVAASRENVNRALTQLSAEGKIAQRDGSFFVLDAAALETEQL